MSWTASIGTAMAAGGLLLGVYNTATNRGARRRERGSASLQVTIREFARKPHRAPREWRLAEHQLVIANLGPGDAHEMSVDATFPEHDDKHEISLEFIGPADRTFDVAAGRTKRISCCVVECRGDDWETDGVQFPVEILVAWRDGSGPRHQAFTIYQPEVAD